MKKQGVKLVERYELTLPETWTNDQLRELDRAKIRQIELSGKIIIAEVEPDNNNSQGFLAELAKRGIQVEKMKEG